MDEGDEEGDGPEANETTAGTSFFSFCEQHERAKQGMSRNGNRAFDFPSVGDESNDRTTAIIIRRIKELCFQVRRTVSQKKRRGMKEMNRKKVVMETRLTKVFGNLFDHQEGLNE